MTDAEVRAIMLDPRYRALTRGRDRLARWLTAVVLVGYLGFILLVAFDKPLLARPIAAGGVTSLGIVVGIGLIALAIALTGIYVARANRAFDPLVAALSADHRQ